MGTDHFEKKYQRVQIRIGMSIAIAICFVFLNLSMMWGAKPPYEKIEKNKANGNGNAHANFDWYFLVLFFKMGCPHSQCPVSRPRIISRTGNA